MDTAKKNTFFVRKRLGEALVENGIITHEQLEKAINTHQEEPASIRRRLSTIIIEDFDADRHEVMKTISRLYAFREVLPNGSPSKKMIGNIRSMLDEIPDDVVDEMIYRKTVPFKADKDLIILASADPTDPQISILASELPYKLYELTYCKQETVDLIINKVYDQKNEFLRILDDIEFEEPEITEEDLDEEELDKEINKSMLNSLVEGMLVEAVRKGASDIHIIPGKENVTDILFRMDGRLQVWHSQPNVKPEALSAVVKDKTMNVDRFERDSTQDGYIQRRIDATNIRFRVSIMPMVGEEFERKLESVVIRVLDDRKVITDLDELGLQEKAYADFNKAINQPSGIVIITGPTGSGKSTTLVAALHSVMSPEFNVLTIEEPVEYLIKGARQLKISESMTFDNAMRGILRHDPDIVLVGEIRDLKTAEIAIKLANTGHLTFSTLHTNDAPSAVSRLFKMGVEPFLIANAINLVMAQRLVRKLCKHCKEQYDKEEIRQPAKNLGFSEDEIEEITFYKPVGCEKCNQGYDGRIAIMEALYFDDEVKRMIFDAGDEIDEDALRKYAIKNGMLTLRASGRKRIKNGITTIEEVMAITLED
ncbi:GspE/PulE family protein [Rhodohalobacter sulfatireducens]|jgi:type IV pilus assembly protein PilB|uniref:GspE/PulE family protein n=1 Tax=Rhodohalobacter sulfatireducens TaxID=2911366 RepID=A0ABS9KEA8_9BACT|nr:GspE/PulE family protein [Rhodohalobacter sulfatireducens]MCG2589194.1 GspE/PulE family protein [Rhodohalobacter sulfatireducens]NBC03966.1 type II/IV secretion system protein [Bacteroidota bacterium]